MAERPLLIFPTPQAATREAAGGGGPDNYVRPSHGRQGERVSLRLSQLQKTLEGRTTEILASAEGVDPSQVIVIETIGSVQNFARTAERIQGFEWLGEFEIDEIAPDDDFFVPNATGKPTDKSMRGRLYLLFTNQAAMGQLLAHWERFKSDVNTTWPHGLTSLRDVFNSLYDIRRWEVQDRLEESGVLEAWKEDLEHFPDQKIRTEIELWYRGSSEARASALLEVESLVAKVGGTVLQTCTLDAIAYQALLVELPRSAVETILKNPATELVKCDSVMYFRPTGQVAAGERPGDDRNDAGGQESRENSTFPVGDPSIAVLDGLPVENHVLLRDRLMIEDPDDLAPHYDVKNRVHGTGICSLVVWGDLSDEEAPLSRPVYLRPVMVPIESTNSNFTEQMPADQLTLDLIHRSVRRIFEGDGDQEASAPNVRIINLSIGDPSRPFLQMVSPMARLLDWLSYKYNVLFVISAGNQLGKIELGMSKTQFEALNSEQRETAIIRNLYRDIRNRRLFSPGEAINGLTVNASHDDGSGEFAAGRLFECYTTPLPSPVSAFGGGYRRSIKPDVVFSGGRVLYDHAPMGDSISPCSFHRSPGHQVAVSSPAPGELNRTAYTRGTSNAAALVTRNLGIAHDTLLELFEEQANDQQSDVYIAPLLKALLVHSCDWNLSGERLREVFVDEVGNREIKHVVSRWLGYGEPDCNRMRECTQQRATVLGFGSLSGEEGHLFQMPLPPSLSALTTERRLTVTLAWLSPIVATNQKYRAAQLWFNVLGNRVAESRQNADWQAARRGTVQHEIFKGENATAITTGDTFQVKVSCKEDAGRIHGRIHYGLAVSLETAPATDIGIYDEVRAGIRQEVGIRSRSITE